MRKIQLIIAFAALMLFAWVIAHVGPSTIVAQLKALRVALPIVMALSALRLFLQSTTWSASLKGVNVAVNTTTLIGVRLASQSMGYLTVLGPVISEPMKIKLLGSSSEPTIKATFLDTGVYWFTSALVAISGVVCLPLIAAHGAAYHWIPVILALALAVFAITRRSPILTGVVRAFGRRAPSWLARAGNFEAAIRTYRLQQPALVSRMFWIGVACQLLIASEVLVVLWSLHLPIHFLAVMAIEGVTRALKMASGWIPARVGFDEGGAISAFAVAGLSPMLGLGLALTRRVRDLLWALMGILWLAWNSRSLSPRHAITLGHSSNLSGRGV
ncbi:lysylphosphatidylglycerol synthase domain-containing protein [Edaphobacter aggregans]|uniref:lysylphosphatidylglycerol synthase domain-containing protein n=1 Tax=Edaphobacter aggregans TaxID=570835 RepID=UPI00054D3A95|nr:lysylphosphatidylglycerol synthase domain-containing protein [Edaphobacter aggregans]